jgi:uncharacterized membrane protein
MAMHVLDLVTILCVGLMTGAELAVSAFVNPVIWKLEESSQAKAASLSARLLGKVMPVWYALCLILLMIEAYARRHSAEWALLDAAVVIWVLVVIYSVTALVPINNRIAQLDLASLPSNWREAHKKWDTLHRLRILAIATAMAFLVWSIVSGS